MSRSIRRACLTWTIAISWLVVAACSQVRAAEFKSYPPTRPLPKAFPRLKEKGAAGTAYFVDAKRGDDSQAGNEEKPWKTLRHALRQLRPGDVLYLRAGTYYEHASLTRSGTEAAPIVIRSYPGELAIVDGGLQEFFDEPDKAWEPLQGGAPGEYVSTRTYEQFDDRRVPTQFLPGSWEPMWGIEEDRPLALGNFGDSMIPLHGYRWLADLRATNEFWIGDKKDHDSGVYCGPGLWFNRETGRIHCRLAHHTLPGLGELGYRGETDPRKLPLVVAVGFGHDVLRISGVKHVTLRDLVLRGATGSPMVHVYGSEEVVLDHVTVFGGFPGLLVNASKGVRVVHSAFRGLAAPWTGRSHMKYRGTASYQIVLQNNQPMNEEIELANCEFTDDHDFAFLRYAKNLRFHNNFVDNFNDDGLECGPKLRGHTIYVYQNRIGACLGVFQQHENDKDESPETHDPNSGVYVYRNVFDGRAGVQYGLPSKPDPSGDFMHYEGHFISDHGSPVYPVMRFYHNTVLRETPVFRGYFLFGLGSVSPKQPTERDVFNNIFAERTGVPGPGSLFVKEAGNLREGGNLLWGFEANAKELAAQEQLLAKFRGSPSFQVSQKRYAPGWTTYDRLANPKFEAAPTSRTSVVDLRLASDSPAIDAGQPIPADWPDPLREVDQDKPDIGALPRGVNLWGVGVDGRLSIFTGKLKESGK